MRDLAIIFDLDGTLVDTAPDLINTLNHLLREEDCPPAAPELIRPFISEGTLAILARGFELAGTHRSREELGALFDRFIRHYSENIAIDSRPYPFLIEVLDALRARGNPLGVCTNKREDLSKRLLSQLGLDHYFAAVIGVDTLAVSKPHPGHLLGTIVAIGGEPARAVMIGDSETDIKTAKAAGIPVIALDFGYSTTPIANFHPDAILSDYRDLNQVIASLFPDH